MLIISSICEALDFTLFLVVLFSTIYFIGKVFRKLINNNKNTSTVEVEVKQINKEEAKTNFFAYCVDIDTYKDIKLSDEAKKIISTYRD